MIQFSQKTKQTLLVILLGLIITVIYFNPIIFENKELRMDDASESGYSNKELRDYREKTGEEVIWTDRLFGGMPLYLTGTKYNSNWANDLSKTIRFLPQSADVIFFSFLGCFIMLICLRVNPIIAGIGAFAYGFNTFSIVSTDAGHIFKILAFAFTPLILGGLALLFRKKYVLGLVLTILGITLSVSSKHFQVLFYFGLFGFIYSLYEFIKIIYQKELAHLFKTIALIFASILIGVGPHISTLWSTMEYTQFSIRGKKELKPIEKDFLSEKASKTLVKDGLDKEYAFAWSEGKWESLTLVIPYLYSGASQEGYWGDQPGTAGPVYAGSIVIFLFMLYLVNIKNIKKYWVLISGALLLFISWGRNFEVLNYFLFDYFPLFNKFRAVAMAIIFTVLAICTGAVLGLDYFIKLNKEEKIKTLKLASISFFSLVLVVYFGTVTFGDFGFKSEIEPNQMNFLINLRKSMLLDSTIKVVFINALVFFLLWFVSKEKLSNNWGVSLIALLLIFDLISIDSKYLNSDSFEFKSDSISELSPTKANKIISKDKSHYRVFDLNNPFNSNRASYFHNSIGGYDAAKLQRYQDMIERHIGTGNYKVLAMLNTKYVIDQKQNVQKTNFENGPAWFVEELVSVNNPDEEIAFLGKEEFEPTKNAVVDVSKFSKEPVKDLKKGEIKLDEYKPNKLIYTSKNSGNGIAVFSEIYYPAGWTAMIDGKEADIFRVNYILRALEIPAGTHKIEFKFAPKSYYTGEKISLIFSILLVLIIVLGFGYEIFTAYKSNKEAIKE